MTNEEIKNRLKAGESVEFVAQETGKPFNEIYKMFESCKKEGYVKIHGQNRLKRKIPNGKLIYREKTDIFPSAYINIDKIVAIVIEDDDIFIRTVDKDSYKIDRETLENITSKMGVI